MTCGIYKIQNNINGKIYIGQSIMIERRWINHRYDAFNSHKRDYEKPLYRAFRKYGLSNFEFTIIEECIKENLNEREKEWIAYFKTDDSQIGYNLTAGGDSYTTIKYQENVIQEIYNLLQNTNLSQNKIAVLTNTSRTTVSGINLGYFRRNENLQYPIRKYTPTKKIYYCIDCGKEIFPTAVRCKSCSDLVQQTMARPQPIELAKLISLYGFDGVGRQFNVSGNTIKKWCKAYKIPYLKKELINWYNNQTKPS